MYGGWQTFHHRHRGRTDRARWLGANDLRPLRSLQLLFGGIAIVPQLRVLFEAGRRGERKAADFADERSFAGVHALVLQPHIGTAKGARTVGAFVLIGSPVVAHMMHH